MKRFFILIASIFLILTLAACGVTEQGDSSYDVWDEYDYDSSQLFDEETDEVFIETEETEQNEVAVQTDAPEIQNNNELRTEFKAAMDSYESYMDEYVEFMKKYKANPTDIRLIAEYAQMMTKYAKMVSDFEKWETEEMNDSEMAYYIQVQSRVTQKLLEVA